MRAADRLAHIASIAIKLRQVQAELEKASAELANLLEMLALGASPWEQGEVAGARALELIFRQPQLARLPITQSQQFVVSMSGARMRARGFTLPRVYEAAARSGNLYLP